ncbi:maleylpyruvate isomerase family mycothiol-dependent enzyme [Pseudonocardia sp. GCM10023141]|uniref:maleylpyruvate isomerase family mycothiol-dependent enzyme n=1 Tax=Pseudonocardia sp. GCM10023141 TaxID=3252653 RepID=UPI00361D57D4
MDHAEALIEENRSLAVIIRGADPALRVPTCPEWTLLQLARHVGRGHRWAATMVRERAETPADPRTVPDGRPPEDPDGVTDWLNSSAQAVLDAVAATGGDTPIWTFTGPKPAAWWVRRRLHEATVHRADAAIAAGVPFVIDPALAADGISEWLDLVSARPAQADAPALADGATLHLHATDDGLGAAGEWLIRGSGGAVVWEPGHGKGDAAVRGPAADLLLAVLRRAPAESVEVLGDATVWTSWLERTGF